MTLQEIKLLHAYDSWANNRMFDAVAGLPADQYMKDLKASHGSIHGTLTHLVAAQKIWLSRFIGKPEQKLVTVAEAPTLTDLKKLWEKVGHDLAQFLGTMTDRKLAETFVMTTTSGKQFTHTYVQALQHVVNHSSYHRGQVAAMMRQVAAVPPNTDMIRFYRETARGSAGNL